MQIGEPIETFRMDSVSGSVECAHAQRKPLWYDSLRFHCWKCLICGVKIIERDGQVVKILGL